MIIGRWRAHAQIMLFLNLCLSMAILGGLFCFVGDRSWSSILLYQCVLICAWLFIGWNSNFLDRVYEAIGPRAQLKYTVNVVFSVGFGLLGGSHLLLLKQLSWVEIGVFCCATSVVVYSIRSLYFPLLSKILTNKEKAVYIGNKLVGYRKSVVERGLSLIGFELVQLNESNLVGQLKEYFSKQKAKLIIVEKLPTTPEAYNIFRETSESFGVRLCFLNDLRHRMGQSYSELDIDGVQYVFGSQEPLGSQLNWMVKRGFDIVGALVTSLLLFFPVTLLVLIIHKFQSTGKLFYSQERVGLDGEIIKVLKFRSMHKSNDCGEDRRFSGGDFLRKYSLDEIPQLWNVLIGDMSLIGPRPHKVDEDDAFQRESSNYSVRRWVRPGMTGLAQVRGYRGVIEDGDELKKRVSSDMYYIDNWSLPMDFMILLRTIYVVLKPHSNAR